MAFICAKLIEIGQKQPFGRRRTKWVARPLGVLADPNGHADANRPRADANGPKRIEYLSEMGRPTGDTLSFLFAFAPAV